MSIELAAYPKNWLSYGVETENTTSRMKKYLKKEANKFTIYRDILYRYNTDNGIIRKALNKKEAEEIMYAYHQHPLGGRA
ncbi:hypothetical protein RO3G_09960 [Rhizopus delemar RA 99-880]|uniref:Uncharacterized protein n=1 Tax=Rhizopus delemar (strain RA 99-880 / ATCC MYA-4621 / FGSC 9543 / NRRL 43880) TaxID=246409 RepID=I1C9X0_RHIO9|nr:hypothetical protein RO3G_09960 [Rhizopus delemar RA 99-880]|eukprot:EIE85250.1 hypothetical protein RO3G_09960 [Rhizopus delemar RA 99-880]